MKKFTLAALIALFLSLAYYFCPLRDPRFHCGIQDALVKQAFMDGYAWLSTAVNSRGYVEQLFLHPDGGYRVIGIDNNFHACVTESGVSWQFVLQTEFPPIK